MKITPIEIKQHTFKTKMRGYCPDEVHAFLQVVSEEYAKQKTEIKVLGQKVKELEQNLLKGTQNSGELDRLTAAINSMKEDLLKNAEKEASLTIEEAKIKATRMIQAAERKITNLEADIRVLENRRMMVKESVSSFLQSQLNSLVTLNSSFEEGEEATEGQKILFEGEAAETAEESEKVSFVRPTLEAELVVPEVSADNKALLEEIEVEPLAKGK